MIIIVRKRSRDQNWGMKRVQHGCVSTFLWALMEVWRLSYYLVCSEQQNYPCPHWSHTGAKTWRSWGNRQEIFPWTKTACQDKAGLLCFWTSESFVVIAGTKDRREAGADGLSSGSDYRLIPNSSLGLWVLESHPWWDRSLTSCLLSAVPRIDCSIQ